jgi:hypothetical protein
VSFQPSRRRVLLGGCGFVAALAATAALPMDAEAALRRAPPAPRHRCPHHGCRHFRLDGEAEDGTCALSIHGVVPRLEVSP